MTIPVENFRMVFTFADGFDLVKLEIATKDVLKLQYVGVIRGRAKLEDLMERTGIDRGVRFTGTFPLDVPEVEAIVAAPTVICDWLDRQFEKADGLDLKILDQTLQAPSPEWSFVAPKGLTVCSSFMTAADGLEQLEECFRDADAGKVASAGRWMRLRLADYRRN